MVLLRSSNQRPRGQKCVAAHPDSINARSPERAQEFCAFLLTWTYIDVGYPEITSVLPFRGYFRIGGHTPGTQMKQTTVILASPAQ